MSSDMTNDGKKCRAKSKAKCKERTMFEKGWEVIGNEDAF